MDLNSSRHRCRAPGSIIKQPYPNGSIGLRRLRLMKEPRLGPVAACHERAPPDLGPPVSPDSPRPARHRLRARWRHRRAGIVGRPVAGLVMAFAAGAAAEEADDLARTSAPMPAASLDGHRAQVSRIASSGVLSSSQPCRPRLSYAGVINVPRITDASTAASKISRRVSLTCMTASLGPPGVRRIGHTCPIF